jgi:hypothetical protein
MRRMRIQTSELISPDRTCAVAPTPAGQIESKQ